MLCGIDVLTLPALLMNVPVSPVVAATPVDQVERNDKRGDNVLDQTMEQSGCNSSGSDEEVCSIVVVSGGSTISTILTTETGTGFVRTRSYVPIGVQQGMTDRPLLPSQSNGFGTVTGIFQSQSISFGSSPTQSTNSVTATSTQDSGSSATATFSQSQSSGGDVVAVSPTVAVTLLTSVGAVVWMIL